MRFGFLEVCVDKQTACLCLLNLGYRQNVRVSVLFPIEYPLSDDVHKPYQQQSHKEDHLNESGKPQGLEVYCPGIQKDDFHIKEDKEDGCQEVLDGYWCTGISLRFYPTLEGLSLDGTLALGPYGMADNHGNDDKAKGTGQLYHYGQVIARQIGLLQEKHFKKGFRTESVSCTLYSKFRLQKRFVKKK
jgi:hypothetical protein